MNNKKRVNFIVTDLDDTIWDWLKMWHASFEPYLNRISKEFGINIEELKKDFKKIHQKYRTTEASFIYHELSSLNQTQKDEFNKSGQKDKKSILHEYYSLKKNNLFLYKGVLATLNKIKDKGSIIVGFTESNAHFTKYRIKQLQLDGIIDYIYAPVDTGIPESVYQHYPDDYWEPEITEMRYLSKKVVKPAPEILEIILKDFNANKDNTIYIGDKLDKDIYMANEASIVSVYAEYGHLIETSQYDLLKEITHWTDEDVQREVEFKKNDKIKPIANYTLEKSFDELSKYFSFFQFNHKANPNKIAHVISIWKKVVDVQQHFNDIALRIRSIALTAFTFIIGGIGYLEIAKATFKINNIEFPYSSILAILGILIMAAFFYMDRYWYHNLLVGAVKQGLYIENKWSKYIPEIRLAHSIKDSSPHNLFCWEIHSKNKFKIFYGLLCAVFLVLGILLFSISNKSVIFQVIARYL